MRTVKHFAQLALSLAATALLGGFLTAVLVRVSPGFGVDEHALDPARDAAALRAIQAARPEQGDFLAYSVRHTAAMFRGDFGISRNWNRPVAGLLRERWPVTAQLMAAGLLGGWALALVFALPGLVYPARIWNALAGGLSGLLLCVPSAALALLLFVCAGPVRAVVALAVFPRVFEYLRNVLTHAAAQPHVMAARARGIGPARIILRHIVPVAAPQVLALAGVSVSMAFGAAVAVEVVCDFPGIGQLAWKAALARDLPLLVTLTMLVTMATQMANAVAGTLASRRSEAGA
ncbi:MAG TPA: ABC transporter permease [Bryobacteraceae bacterium]|jgi:peptide/nickel transport system permease protein|nr:ABC transporter permease [Bryobacteraceae bacterium]